MTKYMGGCAQVLCKYYAILHKGLEHLWILVSAPGVCGGGESWNQSSEDTEGGLYLVCPDLSLAIRSSKMTDVFCLVPNSSSWSRILFVYEHSEPHSYFSFLLGEIVSKEN